MVASLNAGTFKQYERELKNLSPKQIKVLYSSFGAGKEYDLGYTLTAIAWKESNFNVVPINVTDGFKYKYSGSYGPYHVLLENLRVKYSIKNNYIANLYASKLLFNLEFAQNEALAILLHWKERWKDKKYTWSRMVGSYNAGYNSIGIKAGRIYLNDIKLRIKVLRKYIKDNIGR